MGYLDMVKEIEARLKTERESDAQGETTPPSELTLESIPRLTLSELEKRNLAIEVHSDILNCTLWVCPSEEAVKQIRRDCPGAICYTVRELRELLKGNLSPEDLKRIHDVKSTLGSKVIEVKDRESEIAPLPGYLRDDK